MRGKPIFESWSTDRSERALLVFFTFYKIPRVYAIIMANLKGSTWGAEIFHTIFFREYDLLRKVVARKFSTSKFWTILLSVFLVDWSSFILFLVYFKLLSAGLHENKFKKLIQPYRNLLNHLRYSKQLLKVLFTKEDTTFIGHRLFHSKK